MLWWSFSIKYTIAPTLWHMVIYNLASHLGLGGLEGSTKHLIGWESVMLVYVFLSLLILIVFWCLALPQEAFGNSGVDQGEE